MMIGRNSNLLTTLLDINVNTIITLFPLKKSPKSLSFRKKSNRDKRNHTYFYYELSCRR